jgi:putative DNA primase/helicase
LIGSGSNGKTQLLNLILNTIGELGEKLSPTLFTRARRDAGDANPELAKLMHKRFAFVSEPEHGQTFNIAQIKELTGNEKIVARHLYKGPVTFPMICHFYIACNELPKLPKDMDPNDQSLERRFRVVNFNSKFVSNPEKENEYQVDKEIPILMEKDITWRQTMMNILLEYTSKEIEVPESVRLRTKQYQEESNVYLDWIRENLHLSEGKNIALTEICDTFNKIEKVDRRLLKEYIEREFNIKYKRVKINGIAFYGFLGLDYI